MADISCVRELCLVAPLTPEQRQTVREAIAQAQADLAEAVGSSRVRLSLVGRAQRHLERALGVLDRAQGGGR